MTRTQTLLALLATVVVAWGCGKTPTGPPAATNTQSLEARVAKLEQDLKAAQGRRPTWPRSSGPSRSAGRRWRRSGTPCGRT